MIASNEHVHTMQTRPQRSRVVFRRLPWLLLCFSACTGAIDPQSAAPPLQLLGDSSDAGRTSDAATDAAIAPDALCASGDCAEEPDCGDLTRCEGACVDTHVSLVHCGACGIACDAEQACVDGVCSCASGLTACDGACVDADSDPANCGGCGVSCGAERACVQGACTCDGPVVSYAADVAPILERSCTSAGCHTGATARAQLDLALDRSYDELVNVRALQCSDGRKLVQPGNAAGSYLMQKMLGTNLCAGTLMPRGASALPASDLAIVASWICRGAVR